MLSPLANKKLKPLGCYGLGIAMNTLVLIYLALRVKNAPTHKCSRYIKAHIGLRIMSKKENDSIVVTDRPRPLQNQLSSESNGAGLPSTERSKYFYDICLVIMVR